MRDDLLEYYERELTFLRQMGAEFAARYPKVASRLLMEPTKCEDPHVERLLEGFAFLAARVHLKIDDDLPEISQSMLELVYPHYVRPIPSLSIVQFHVDPEQGKLTTGFQIPRETLLYSRPVAGHSVQVPHLLRHHAVAGFGGGGGVENAGSVCGRPSAAGRK